MNRPKRSEEHTSELQSRRDLVCRLLLEKKKGCWPRRGKSIEQILAVCRIGKTCQIAGVLKILFFFNDTATTEIYTLSLHDALPILIEPAIAVATSQRKNSPPRSSLSR